MLHDIQIKQIKIRIIARR